MSTSDQRSVVIDCFPERVPHYGPPYTIVGIDVFRATTTALTAAVLGRRCFPVGTIEAATERAEQIPGALLGGELGGHVPYGFEVDNSPVRILGRDDIERPLILISTSGTRVVCDASPDQAVFAACLRNTSAQVAALVAEHPRVAVIGAGARGEFREEDAMCCARIAEGLVEAGYRPENAETEEIIARWKGAPVRDLVSGHSAEFLHSVGRDDDLEFILTHVDDVSAVLELKGNELVLRPVAP